MTDFDLDEIRLKTSEELNDEEKSFLKENVDKLTDEDKEAYAGFLTTKPEENSDDNGDGAGNGEDGGGVGAGGKPPAPYVFKSEDEARSFVAKTVSEEQAKQKQAAIDSARTPEEKLFVEKNWKPKDWNEGIKTIKDVVKQELKDEQAEETKKQETQRRAFESEWDGIVSANKLPKRDTEEGRKVLKSVYDIGIKYNQPNFTKAYELYKAIPKSQGGGLEVMVNSSVQRNAAGKVVGNTPDGNKGKSVAPKSYGDLHNKSMSQLVRDAGKSLS